MEKFSIVFLKEYIYYVYRATDILNFHELGGEVKIVVCV